MIKLFIYYSVLLINLSCGSSGLGQSGTTPPSHATFDQLLQAHVSEQGTVDYKGFMADVDKLDAYLASLSSNAPDRAAWSEAEQLAYWINAYNAFTIKLILDHYPVKSIKDIGPKLTIPIVNTVWHLEFFEIGGKPASLDEIEHKILRKEFDEPRIHFAINCASISCPKLMNHAYSAKNLDAQLQQAAYTFINNPMHNSLTKEQAELSPLFSWFEEDFTRKGSLVDFINQYAENKLNNEAKISFKDYNWSLNE
ncbi:MAG: DUF547 domain-containing protein [Cytophagales bacterium]|uniref:DUF547 domain-containing protein n=1 Tax=Cyclobacterium marinum TaxID=104 RepID=UPI0030DB9E18|nr:DUF547 domain-containing protein [Cytophagales bacterium]|tara:strand:+ start:8685 stop:9443 length:759 start_codon:yes stop_codon:yes gene_type:complete